MYIIRPPTLTARFTAMKITHSFGVIRPSRKGFELFSFFNTYIIFIYRKVGVPANRLYRERFPLIYEWYSFGGFYFCSMLVSVILCWLWNVGDQYNLWRQLFRIIRIWNVLLIRGFGNNLFLSGNDSGLIWM